jgi:hypothetical protein
MSHPSTEGQSIPGKEWLVQRHTGQNDLGKVEGQPCVAPAMGKGWNDKTVEHSDFA